MAKVMFGNHSAVCLPRVLRLVTAGGGLLARRSTGRIFTTELSGLLKNLANIFFPDAKLLFQSLPDSSHVFLFKSRLFCGAKQTTPLSQSQAMKCGAEHTTLELFDARVNDAVRLCEICITSIRKTARKFSQECLVLRSRVVFTSFLPPTLHQFSGLFKLRRGPLPSETIGIRLLKIACPRRCVSWFEHYVLRGPVVVIVPCFRN